MKSLPFLFIIILILVGCTDNSAQEALELNHAQVGTQVADLRITATVQAARAETTLDFIGTRSSAAATQSQFLEATLIATGFSPQLLENFRQRQFEATSTPTSTATPTVSESSEAQPDSTSRPTFLDTATPTIPAVSPFAPVVAASPTAPTLPNIDVNAPHLENPVLSTGVGTDDCAVGVTTQFSTVSSEIYVVAEAVNVPSGSVIEARWYREGNPVGPIYDFRPDFDIERACIWFFVDPTDFEFTAGQYSVDLLLNGELATSQLPFTIE